MHNFSFFDILLTEDANGEEKEALQMELDHMMYVGKHPNIIELIGVCSIKGMLSCHLDTFFSQ